MNFNLLLSSSEHFLKLSSEIFVFTFVPKDNLDLIKSKGLLSAAKLIEDEVVLKAVKGKKAQKFKQDIEKKLSDPEWQEIVSGVSSFFTLPDWQQLSEKHFIFQNDLVPIRINLTKLINEESGVKLLGVELEPYNSKKKEQPNRERKLSLKEIKDFINKQPSELWKNYDNPDNDKYAPEVPHLIIIVPSGKIKSKYLDL